MDAQQSNTPGTPTNEKVPPLLLRIVTDAGFISSIISGFGIFVAIRFMADGMPPEQKVELYKSGLLAFFGIVSTATGAAGYKVGKLYEGATPVGFVPTTGTPSVTAIQHVAEPLQMTTATLKDYEGKSPFIPETEATYTPTPTPTPTPFRPGFAVSKMIPVLAMLAVFGALSLSGGCAKTSEPFKRSIGASVNNVVEDMQTYTATKSWDVNGDGAVDASEWARRDFEQSQTDALAASVADPQRVTLAEVLAAWRPVKPIWTWYVQHDPTLPTPEDRNTRLNTGAAIDASISAEAGRQNALRTKLYLPAVAAE